MAFLAQAKEKLADYDRMKEANEQAKDAFNQLQSQGLVNIDDQGNITPSKKKPDAEFLDFERE